MAETAAIVYTVAQTMSESITDVILNPEQYDHPEARVRQTFEAVKTAIERILKAEPGSLPIAGARMLAPWFEE